MKKLNLLLVIVLLYSVQLWAQEEKISPPLLSVNATETVKDERMEGLLALPQWETSFNVNDHEVYNAEGIVRLEVDESVKLDISSRLHYQFDILVECVGVTADINDAVSHNTSLSIEYDPEAGTTYKDAALKVFQNVHWMRFTVTGITDLTTNSAVTDVEDLFILRGILDIERYKKFDPTGDLTAPPSCDLVCPCTTPCDFIEMTGSGIQFIMPEYKGAEFYDLEWTWIDANRVDASGQVSTAAMADIEFSFDNNATRVRRPAAKGQETRYTISNTYREGYIAFRYRALGRQSSDPSYYAMSQWLPKNAANNKFINAASYTPAFIEFIDANGEHEGDKNWQFVTSFAEEGKRKDVISYYDGLNKNRQAVTYSKEDEVSTVGQTIYDHEGRPAVQVLPVPVDGKDDLTYENELNKSTVSGNQYEATDFDGSSPPKPMQTQSGASWYYSDQNHQNGYIPDAQGYPFSQTVYTPDGTGRVLSQSGVGLDHIIGSTHETEYLYGEPNYVDLAALFGNEIGEGSHYKETIVIDPNGQMSVSYIDQHGRVIATSLSGGGTTNMEDLSSVASSTQFEVLPLNQVGNLRIPSARPTAYELLYPYTCKSDEEHTFWYEFQPEDYVLTCNNICFDCYYDLEISVTDEDGLVLLSAVKTFEPLSGVNVGCDANSMLSMWGDPLVDDIESSTVKLNLSKGKTYYIYKKLSVNTNHVDEYWDLYLASTDNCLDDYEDFYQLALSEMADCDELDNYDGEEGSAFCNHFYNLMVTDLSPGGQYASTNSSKSADEGADADDQLIDKTWLHSIFNDSEDANGDVETALRNFRSDFWGASEEPIWSQPLRPYRDANGNEVLMEEGSGVWVKPEELSSFELLAENWQSSFVESLIEYHPEYPHYAMCKLLEPSFEYNDEMLLTTTMDEAESAGYISSGNFFEVVENDPMFISNGSAPYAMGDCEWWEAQDYITPMCQDDVEPANGHADWLDSYSLPGGVQIPGSVSVIEQMNARLLLYSKGKYTDDDGNESYIHFDIKSIAARTQCMMKREGDEMAQNGCRQYDATYFNNPALVTDADIDEQWQIYAKLYVGAKNDLMIDIIEQMVAKNYQNRALNEAYSNEALQSVSTDPLAHLYSEATPHFDRSEQFQFVGNDDEDIDYNAHGDSDSHIDNMEGELSTIYEENVEREAGTICAANEMVWRRQLAMCPNITSTQTDQLIAHFRTICIGSFGPSRLAGGTSLPADYEPVPAYYSFEEALEGVLGSNYESTYCNLELFSVELPTSGHELSLDELKKEDDCACEYLERIVEETITQQARRNYTLNNCHSNLPEIVTLLNGFVTSSRFNVALRSGASYSTLSRTPDADFFYNSMFVDMVDVDPANPTEFMEYRIKVDPVTEILIMNFRKVGTDGAPGTFFNIQLFDYDLGTGLMGPTDLFQAIWEGGAPLCAECSNFTLQWGTTSSKFFTGQGPDVGTTCADNPTIESVIEEITYTQFTLAGINITHGDLLRLIESCEGTRHAFELANIKSSGTANECVTRFYPSAKQVILAQHLTEVAKDRQEFISTEDKRNVNCSGADPYNYLIANSYKVYQNSLMVDYDPYNNYMWSTTYNSDIVPASSIVDASNYFFGCKFITECDMTNVDYCWVALGYINVPVPGIDKNNVVEISQPYYDYVHDRWLVMVWEDMNADGEVDYDIDRGVEMIFDSCDDGETECFDASWWGMDEVVCNTNDFHFYQTEQAEYACDCEVPEFEELFDDVLNQGSNDLFNTTAVDVSGLDWMSNIATNHLDLFNPTNTTFYYEMISKSADDKEMTVKFGNISGGDYCYIYLKIPEGTPQGFSDIDAFLDSRLNLDRMDIEAYQGVSKLQYSSAHYVLDVSFTGIAVPGEVLLYSDCYLANCAVVSTTSLVIPDHIKKLFPCPSCIDCKDIAEKLEDFVDKYPTIGYNHSTFPNLLTSFLNTEFKSNHVFSDYEEYIANCRLATDVLPGYNDCHLSFELNVADVSLFNSTLALYNGTLETQYKSFLKYTVTNNGGSYRYCFNFDHMSNALAAEVTEQIAGLPYQGTSLVWPNYPDPSAGYPNAKENELLPNVHQVVMPNDISATYSSSLLTFVNDFNTQHSTSVGMSTSLQSMSINENGAYADYFVADISYGTGLLAEQHQELIDGIVNIMKHTNEAKVKLGRMNIEYRNTRHEGFEICNTQETSCESCDEVRDIVLDFDRYLVDGLSQQTYLKALRRDISSKLGHHVRVDWEIDACVECTDKNLFVCDELSSEAEDMKTWLDAMATLDITVGTTLGTNNDFLNAEFYPNAASDNPIYSSTVNAAGNQLTINVADDKLYSLNIVLYTEDGSVCDFSTISSFEMLEADNLKRGDNYEFSIIALHMSTAGITDLKGRVDAFPLVACCYFDDLELCYTPQMATVKWEPEDCEDWRKRMATNNATGMYEEYLEMKRLEFHNEYIESCTVAFDEDNEVFQMKFPNVAHHQTLYYYDQAGNLVQTVPPKGVKKLSMADAAAVANNPDQGNHYPAHTHNTHYKYNSLNQVSWQQTPDGGITEFFYDHLGRIIFSQTAKQAAAGNFYSYTVYDHLNRAEESGEAELTTPINRNTIYSNLTYQASLLSSALSKKQVTYVRYNTAYSAAVATEFGPDGQENLRNRVACTYYKEDATSLQYDYASHFSYDPHGMVKTLIQEYPELVLLGHAYKRIDYEYDLISGNVKTVYYQKDKADQFIHRYTYDEQNRITEVETSRDGRIWDRDAKYEYYLHGPLARTIIGEHEVQGVDYLYTIQGWLKGMNSATLDVARDPGNDDGDGIARDAIGYNLHYYTGDYIPVGTTAGDVIPQAGTGAYEYASVGAGIDLYNGNIGAMTTGNRALMKEGKGVLGTNFHYDQLNRLKSSNHFIMDDATNITNSWTGVAASPYWHTEYQYDANGNLEQTFRMGHKDYSKVMDDLQYEYTAGTNKLTAVADEAHLYPVSVGDPAYTAAHQSEFFSKTDGGVEDIDPGQDIVAGNYFYDASGNLIKDVQEEIDAIEWTAAGKVKEVRRTSGSVKSDLEFNYGPNGNRIRKLEKKTGREVDWRYQYYVRDANGQVMAIYEKLLRMDDEETNYESIGDWLEAYNSIGLSTTIDVLAAAYGNNATFKDRLLTELLNNGLQTPVASNFSVADLLGWEEDLSIDVFKAYDSDASSFDFMLDGMITNSNFKQDFIDGLWQHYAVAAIQILLDNDASNDYLNCFSLIELNQLIADMYVSPPPAPSFATVNDAINHLKTNYSNNQIAVGMHSYMNSPAKDALKLCPGNALLTGAWTYSNFQVLNPGMSTFFDDISSYIDATDLAAWLVTDPDPSIGRTFNYLVNNGNAFLMLSAIAANDGYSFVNHGLSVLPLFAPVYSTMLPGIDGNSPSLFAYMVKVEMGETVYNQMMDDLVDQLEYVESFKTADFPVYGSSRLGAKQDRLLLVESEFTATGVNADGSLVKGSVSNGSPAPGPGDFTEYGRTIGEKQYELSNHLGNVLATITDRKVLTEDPGTSDPNDWWWDADVASAQDYYPFGMLMPDRVYTRVPEPETITIERTEVQQTIIYDQDFSLDLNGSSGSVGMSISLDNGRLKAESTAQPQRVVTTYATEAGKKYKVRIDLDRGTCNEISLWVLAKNPNSTIATLYDIDDGIVEYEFTAASIETKILLVRWEDASAGTQTFYVDRITLYEVNEVLVQETVELASLDGYRYGFNGMERGDSWNGAGNSYDFGARIYNPRIGRFLSMDPRAADYAYYSPYLFAGNCPVRLIDINGEGPGDVVIGFMAAMADYGSMGLTDFRNWTEVAPENAADYNKGLQLADQFMVALALAEMAGGGGMTAGGLLTMQAGVATLVVPGVGEVTFAVAELTGGVVALAGVAVATHGAYILEMAQENISNQEGHREESKRKPTKTERMQQKKAKKSASQKKKQQSSAESEYNQKTEHTTNQTQSNRPRHQKGQKTDNMNQGGEKADVRRIRHK